MPRRTRYPRVPSKHRRLRSGPAEHVPLRRGLPLSVLALLLAAACQDPSATAPDLPSDPLEKSQVRTHGADVRLGFILGEDGKPHEITYEVLSGIAVREGDIVIGRADEIPESAAELMASVRAGGGGLVTQGSILSSLLTRWPAGIVPYEIYDNLDDNGRITSAIKVIERSTAGVDFQRRNGQPDYVRFVAGLDFCSSQVGMIGGGQNIELNPGYDPDDARLDCSWASTVHEMLHTLGMEHEQTRCDRDAFVEIIWANITPGRLHNFEKHCAGHDWPFDYDEGSIMHYGPFAFALIETEPTIVSLRGRDSEMGQSSGLSDNDIRTVNRMYAAFNDAPVAVIAPLEVNYPEGSPVRFDASVSHDPDDETLWYHWDFGDGNCDPKKILPPLPGYCEVEKPEYTFADDGEYTIKVQVTDVPPDLEHLGSYKRDNTTATVTVINVPPTITAPNPLTFDEGSRFRYTSSFHDPGTRDGPFKLTVDYGDGGGVQPLTVRHPLIFDLDHTYVDNQPGNAPYTLVLTATDKDGGTGTDDTQITVLNAPPLVDAGPNVTITSGDVYAFSGSFTDAGLLDAPWNWQINWGNGDKSTGSAGNQVAPITESRLLCEPGDYAFSFLVTDKDGGSNVDFVQVSVSHLVLDLLILPGGDPNPVNLRRGGLLAVAILSTPTFNAADVDPDAVTLGDGSGTDTRVAKHQNGAFQSATEDIDGDGLLDLVLMFDVRTLVANGDLTDQTTMLVLNASLLDACTQARGEGSILVRSR